MTTAVSNKPNYDSLTEEQAYGVKFAKEWFPSKTSKQMMKIAGFAGTGKSFLVQFIIKELNLDPQKEVAFLAPTGKAALVLTQKANGEYQATTIHKLIYELDDSSKVPAFILRNKETLKEAGIKLIVVDEWSMVDGKTEQDLLSFGIKIMAVGDQGQLDPVVTGNTKRGSGLSNPDVVLTKIHRQAEGSSIIYLSMLARERKIIKPGRYDENVFVLRKRDLESQRLLSLYMRSDQVLCGRNNTRKKINNDIRQALGFTSPLPQVSDKVICTKNNWDKSIKGIPLVNGITGFVEYSKEEHAVSNQPVPRDVMKIKFRPDFMDEKFDDILLLHDHFKQDKVELQRDEYSLYDQFDYGYAITAHKSQGSQWDNVVVLNEVLNKGTHHKWLYTAITRAAEKLVLIVD